MSWRRLPPVLSPIDPTSVIRGGAAALGLIAPHRDDLERQLSSVFDARDTILTDSGTSALVLALRAAVAPGETVAMPGYACIDLIAAAIAARVRVTLYDVRPQTLEPDPESARAALRAGARALVVAPLYGYPQDMTMLARLSADERVPLIEDAAQGAGATISGRRVGSFGALSIISFGRGKGTTGGSGGALLIREPKFLEWGREARRSLIPPGRGVTAMIALAAQWTLARPELYAIPTSIPALALGEMVYHEAGEPAELSAASAIVVRTALAMNDAEVAARRRRATELMRLMEGSAGFAPVFAIPGSDPGYLRLAVLDKRGDARPEPALGALRGYPVTLDEHEATRRVLVADQRPMPGARTLRDRLFTLPTHSRVSNPDAVRIGRWLRGAPPG